MCDRECAAPLSFAHIDHFFFLFMHIGKKVMFYAPSPHQRCEARLGRIEMDDIESQSRFR